MLTPVSGDRDDINAQKIPRWPNRGATVKQRYRLDNPFAHEQVSSYKPRLGRYYRYLSIVNPNGNNRSSEEEQKKKYK